MAIKLKIGDVVQLKSGGPEMVVKNFGNTIEAGELITDYETINAVYSNPITGGIEVTNDLPVKVVTFVNKPKQQ